VPNVNGNKVEIMLPGYNYLTLAEVEVYGELKATKPTRLRVKSRDGNDGLCVQMLSRTYLEFIDDYSETEGKILVSGLGPTNKIEVKVQAESDIDYGVYPQWVFRKDDERIDGFSCGALSAHGQWISLNETNNETKVVEYEVGISGRDCKIITFTTMTEKVHVHSLSTESFEIVGYGEVPASCHDTYGATCNIELCGMETLEIKAKSNDGWYFTITGDIGTLLDYTTPNSGKHFPPFPTWVDGDGADNYQKYSLKDWHWQHTTSWEQSVVASVTGGFTINEEETVSKDRYLYGSLLAKTVEKAVSKSHSVIESRELPIGEVWQFVFDIEDTCVENWQLKTDKLAVTPNSTEQPCCLPGFESDPNVPHGPCKLSSPCFCEQEICDSDPRYAPPPKITEVVDDDDDEYNEDDDINGLNKDDDTSSGDNFKNIPGSIWVLQGFLILFVSTVLF